jgi:hypothetical protein
MKVQQNFAGEGIITNFVSNYFHCDKNKKEGYGKDEISS